LWLSLVLMVFVGFGLMQCASVSNTIIQSLVPEDKRARVMSYYTMAFFGAAPFGSLLAGALAPDRGAAHRDGHGRVLHRRLAVVHARAAEAQRLRSGL
jgi:MFS family permease